MQFSDLTCLSLQVRDQHADERSEYLSDLEIALEEQAGRSGVDVTASQCLDGIKEVRVLTMPQSHGLIVCIVVDGSKETTKGSRVVYSSRVPVAKEH